MSAFPAAPDGCTGQVFMRVGNCGLKGLDQSFQVLPGQYTLSVIFQDKNAPGTGRELTTDPVAFSVMVAAGREYRIRGLSKYTPGTTWEERSQPLHTRYRVRLIAQDIQSGRIVAAMEVPRDRIKPLE